MKIRLFLTSLSLLLIGSCSDPGFLGLADNEAVTPADTRSNDTGIDFIQEVRKMYLGPWADMTGSIYFNTMQVYINEAPARDITVYFSVHPKDGLIIMPEYYCVPCVIKAGKKWGFVEMPIILKKDSNGFPLPIDWDNADESPWSEYGDGNIPGNGNGTGSDDDNGAPSINRYKALPYTMQIKFLVYDGDEDPLYVDKTLYNVQYMPFSGFDIKVKTAGPMINFRPPYNTINTPVIPDPEPDPNPGGPIDMDPTNPTNPTDPGEGAPIKDLPGVNPYI